MPSELSERINPVADALARFENLNSLREDRINSLLYNSGRAQFNLGRKSGNDRFITIAYEAQQAFDEEEGDQTKREYEDHVRLFWGNWETERNQLLGEANRNLEEISAKNQDDDNIIKNAEDSIRVLRESHILDNASGGGSIRNQIARIEDRIGGLKGNIQMIRDLEIQTRRNNESLQYYRGTVEGARFEWDKWYQIADRLDNDEGDWARYGGDQRSRGWQNISESLIIRPSQESVEKDEMLLNASKITLLSARRQAKGQVSSVLDILAYMRDLIRLIDELLGGGS